MQLSRLGQGFGPGARDLRPVAGSDQLSGQELGRRRIVFHNEYERPRPVPVHRRLDAIARRRDAGPDGKDQRECASLVRDAFDAHIPTVERGKSLGQGQA